jgi:hypothetical protein
MTCDRVEHSLPKTHFLFFVFPKWERPADNRSVLFSSFDGGIYHTLMLKFIHETLPVKKKGGGLETKPDKHPADIEIIDA